VPLVIVTVVPMFVQAPLVVIVAVVLAFVVADTLKDRRWSNVYLVNGFR